VHVLMRQGESEGVLLEIIILSASSILHNVTCLFAFKRDWTPLYRAPRFAFWVREGESEGLRFCVLDHALSG
jgi:hypothetical protein